MSLLFGFINEIEKISQDQKLMNAIAAKYFAERMQKSGYKTKLAPHIKERLGYLKTKLRET